MNNFKIAIAKAIVESLVSPQNKKTAGMTVEWVLKNFGDEIEGIAINSATASGKLRFGKWDIDYEEEEVKRHYNSLTKKVQSKWDKFWSW